MADILPIIETLENRWMRAWASREARELKALTARDFMLLVGSQPAVLLDRRSWLEAAAERWRCSSWRFGDLHVRRIGGSAIFASQLDLKASIDGHDWSGRLWVTDLWRKRRIGGWRMAERLISRIDDDPQLPAAVKALQLWR